MGMFDDDPKYQRLWHIREVEGYKGPLDREFNRVPAVVSPVVSSCRHDSQPSDLGDDTTTPLSGRLAGRHDTTDDTLGGAR